jgi:small-conductance mechanosensitive channel
MSILQPALAQTPPDEAEAQPEPPAISSLTTRWWGYFADVAGTEGAERDTRFLTVTAEQLAQLSPKSRAEAEPLLDSIRSNLEIYREVSGAPPPRLEELPPPAEAYSLEQLAALLDATRVAAKFVLEDELEVSRAKRQRDAAARRRDLAFKEYINSEFDDERWLQGLRLVQARSQLAIAEQRLQLFTADYDNSVQYQRRLNDRLTYARSRLEVSGDDAALAAEEERTAAARAQLEAAQAELDAAELAAAELQLNTEEGKARQRVQQRKVLRARVEVAVREVLLAQADLQRRLTDLAEAPRPPTTRLQEVELDWRRVIERITDDRRLWQQEIEEELLLIQGTNTANLDKKIRKLLDEREELAKATLTRLGNLEDYVQDFEFTALLLNDMVSKVAGRFETLLAAAYGKVREVGQDLISVGDKTLFGIGESPVTVDDLFSFILIIAIAVVLSRVVRHTLAQFSTSKGARDSSTLYTFGRLFHYLIITLAIIVGLASIGIDFSSLALVAGALGVGIGFGLQSIVNNFVSGLIILFEQTLRVGDYIELDTGVTGTVKDISVRSTLINTNDNIDIIVPNAEIVSNKLTNWTLGEYILRVRIPFGVAYGTDKELVKRAAIEATENVSYTLTHMKGREPDVWLVEFGDNSLNFLLLVWVNRQGARRPTRTRASYLWELDNMFKKYGIQVPFPQRDLHLRSGWPGADDLAPAEPDPAD